MSKVIAEYQVFFDYYLPRTPDWEQKIIEFELIEHMKLELVPRGLNDPLFITDLEQLLPTTEVKIKPISKFSADPGFTYKPRIVDRVTLRLHFTIDSIDNLKSALKREELLLIAIKELNHFLDHCKAESLSPFIRPIGLTYRHEEDKISIDTPLSESYFDADSEQILSIFEVNGELQSQAVRVGTILSPEAGNIPFEQLSNSLIRGQPNLATLLISDSLYYLTFLQLHEAVLLAASAFEIQSEIFMQKLTSDQRHAIRKIVQNKQISVVEKTLKWIPIEIFGKEFPNVEQYTNTLNLYRTRNKVTHEAQLYFTDDNKDKKVPTAKHVHEMIMASAKSIEWLEKLI